MSVKSLVVIACLLAAGIISGCSNEPKPAKISKEEAIIEENKKKLDEMNHQYARIPDERILEDHNPNTPLYNELKARYKEHLKKLQKDVAATGAQFVVVIINNGAGHNPALSNLYGNPYIVSVCKELGIECVDLSPVIAQQDPYVVSQTPRDGHWSKKGAAFLASQLAPIIRSHSNAKSTVTYKDSERPETFGDLPPNDDEVLDGGKDMPYHVQANAQGCRMTHDIKFPKTKQHILFLGGSQLYSPYLDNEFIAVTLLEKQFPNAELINTAAIASTIDDYVSLFEEKAKYCEPDLVIVQTNGGDITDFFFTNRNHLSRIQKPRMPSAIEDKYYSTYLR